VCQPDEIAALHPLEYEHPNDRKALNALDKTPGLKQVLRWFNKQALDRVYTYQDRGSGLQLGEDQFPELDNLVRDTCRVLDLPDVPEAYMRWGFGVNAATTGAETPILILDSGCVDLLDESERRFVIGHEIGHIKSRHVRYSQLAVVLRDTAAYVGALTLGIGQAMVLPLTLALLWWHRMSEFTADRAGLLACQDLDPAMRTLSKMAGAPLRSFEDINLDAFMEQVRSFETMEYEQLNRVWKFIALIDDTHPWTVMRASELVRWVESGEYDAVLRRQTQVARQHSATSGFCAMCGRRLEGGEQFCPGCGSPIDASYLPSTSGLETTR